MQDPFPSTKQAICRKLSPRNITLSDLRITTKAPTLVSKNTADSRVRLVATRYYYIQYRPERILKMEAYASEVARGFRGV
jgi:hypothetical protein